jgi:serine protease Do
VVSEIHRLNNDLAALVSRARNGLVRINDGRRGVGAGTIWHPEGLIISNAHVTGKRYKTLEVTLPDGRILPARLLARDEDSDIAALVVNTSDLPAMELGNSKALQPGDFVLAVGHPWGVLGAATMGVVIDVGIPPEMASLDRDMIQVSLHLRPGHSGGPLLDAKGRLVGVNTMMAGPDVGMAVPVNEVKAFLKERLGRENSMPGRGALRGDR